MQQGDAYALPIRIAGDKALIISPDNCTDVKIMVKGIGEKVYSAGELGVQTDYEGKSTGYWLYPLTQQETLNLGPVVLMQAQVMFSDGSIVGTATKAVKIGQSIIRTEFAPPLPPAQVQVVDGWYTCSGYPSGTICYAENGFVGLPEVGGAIYLSEGYTDYAIDGIHTDNADAVWVKTEKYRREQMRSLEGFTLVETYAPNTPMTVTEGDFLKFYFSVDLVATATKLYAIEFVLLPV